MSPYADTSFLASFYCRDANSRAALDVVQSGFAGFPVSSFLKIEMTHAFQSRIFRGEWSVTYTTQIQEDFQADLESGLLLAIEPSWPEVFRVAADIASIHVARIGNRTLDTLHVASAVVAHAGKFFSFDERQRLVASAVGLGVWRP